MVVVDCGDMFLKKKSPEELRAKTIATAMGVMKYDAINPGEEDFGLGASFFVDQVRLNNLPIVSATVKLKDDKKNELIKPYMVKDFNGLKIGITGIAPKSFFKLEGKDVDSVILENKMSEKLASTVKELKNEINVDLVIAMTHLGFDPSKNLLLYNDFEGLDIAVSGHGRYQTKDPEKIKNTFLVQNSMSGEYLGVMKVGFGSDNKPESCTLENVVLGIDLPEDPVVKKLVNQFESEAGKLEELNRVDAKVKDENESVKKVLKLSPKEFVEKMKGREGQTVPLN